MAVNFPLVSVIIPVYNRDRYLAEAIESVLAQTYPAIELIVVDDGSTDLSAEVAQRYLPNLIYFYQQNGGISAARNTGIGLAQGEFLAFLDSDDIWMPDKLSQQMAAFTSDPNLEAVFGYVQQFYSPELDETFRQRIRCPEQPSAAYISSAMLIKRSAFLRVGEFETELKTGVDISWYARAVEQQLRQLMLPDIVYHRRLHETNSGLTERQHANQRLHILKTMLDRRRQSNLPQTTQEI